MRYESVLINQYIRVPQEITAEYRAENDGVRHCIGLVLMNLLANCSIAYSRNKNFYSGNRTQYYTFTNMIKAVEIVVGSGYAIEGKRGYKAEGFKTGFSSTLTAGPRLSTLKPVKKLELDIESLPLLVRDGKPIFEGIANDAIYREALKLNREYWNKIIIGNAACLSRVGLTRVFKAGEVGRWFQKGGISYQELQKEDRPKLLLNGEAVVELDYPAMHPHILYAWEGQQCPDDFYERIMARCRCSRLIAKLITLYAVNANSYKSMVGAINHDKATNDDSELYDELKRYKLKPGGVVDAIGEVHPIIKKYIYSGAGNKLMLVESNIITSALLRLLDLGIAALPVHDSLIAPLEHKGTVKRVMEDVYKQHMGFSIRIK